MLFPGSKILSPLHDGSVRQRQRAVVMRTLKLLSHSSMRSQASFLPRSPRSLQALYLKPLKHEADYGLPTCDLQLRSFSLQPLDFFADFALRAAYYIGLSAYGPIPLPRLTERWTVPRSHFIFKKAQENFERVTLRRMIQIKDGDAENVRLWLAYLQRYQYYGSGQEYYYLT
ncbi:hypothetical protein CDD83_6324 [Cordyceps sp. RAO-2017]|nr:hypothetical protein CDD83_6324 [Cordyceps sp. RAO-2017]